MRVHDVARRDVCRWIARCPRLAGAIDAGLLGGHQQLCHIVQNMAKESSILSRSTLYAPLAAYNQTSVAPEDYLRSVNSLPRSIGEKALVTFLGHVSLHHHLTQKSLHGKNTSARALHENEMKERVQQRGLTLVGGGFFKVPSKRKVAVLTRQSRKRRKLVPSTKDPTAAPEEVWNEQNRFLDKLNKKWNEYAWSLLHPGPVTPCIVNLADIATRAKLLSRTMEWVGAMVRLDRCVSCREWIGRQGILVAETACTWQIFWDSTRQGKSHALIVVPKHGTTVTAILPILGQNIGSSANSEQSYATDELREAKSKSECLFIVLGDNANQQPTK
jgi:hypothetical protein